MTYEEAKKVLKWALSLLDGHHYISDSYGTIDPTAKTTAFGMAIGAIDKALAMQWVPVSERLPELIPCSAGTAYSEAVITLTSERRVVEAIYDGNEFIGPYDFWECEDGERVTHWAPIPMPLPPLPEPPKEEQT